MSRQVDHETTVRWTCDICGKSDLSSFSAIVTPTAPEGLVWLLTFQHDHEPRIEQDYGSYTNDENRLKIPLPKGMKNLNANLICLTCAKNLKAITKDAKVPEPPKANPGVDMEQVRKMVRLRVAAKFGLVMMFAFLFAAAVIVALLISK